MAVELGEVPLIPLLDREWGWTASVPEPPMGVVTPGRGPADPPGVFMRPLGAPVGLQCWECIERQVSDLGATARRQSLRLITCVRGDCRSRCAATQEPQQAPNTTIKIVEAGSEVNAPQPDLARRGEPDLTQGRQGSASEKTGGEKSKRGREARSQLLLWAPTSRASVDLGPRSSVGPRWCS